MTGYDVSMYARFRQYLPSLLLWAGILFNIFFLYAYGERYLDGDMSVEILLADHLNRTHRIVSSDFYYTTEIRVFNIQWLFRLGLLLFPDHWHQARVFAMILLYLLYAGILLKVSSRFRLGEAGRWAAVCLFLPFGTYYRFLLLYGGYYLIYTLYSLVSLYLILVPRRPAGTLCLSLVALMSGLNGVKQMFVTYAPVLLASLFLLRQKERHVQAGAFLAAGMNTAGILANILLFRDIHVYRYTDAVLNDPARYLSFRIHDLGKVFGDLASLFGSAAHPLFSQILFLGLLAGVITVLLREKKTPMHTLSLFVICAGLFDGLLFTVLFHFYNSSYWLPLLPVLVLCGVYGLSLPVPKNRSMPGIALSFCLLLSSVQVVRQELAHPLRAKPGLVQAARFLEDNGYTRGYASFWNAHVISELTALRTEVTAVYDLQTLSFYPWGQRAHTSSEAYSFILVDTYECDPRSLPYYEETAVLYEDDRFVIIQYK